MSQKYLIRIAELERLLSEQAEALVRKTSNWVWLKRRRPSCALHWHVPKKRSKKMSEK
ncbi:putative transposase [Escherichia coli BCE008_MS-13]|nr:putative transposase [Escherichia coli BCE008_MS-13]